MKQTGDVKVVHRAGNIVGECPLWHVGEQALYWIDARKPSLQRLGAGGAIEHWELPHKIGSFVFREKGGLIAAMQIGFCELDLDPLAIRPIIDPEPDKPDNRMNDGKCDRRGRFWSGSRDPTDHNPGGALHRLDPDFGCTTIDTGFIVFNGLAFSPDDKTVVCGCTRGDVMYRYDFDLDAGTISNRRDFLRTEHHAWQVDGATFDSEGYYWCALLGGWAVGRFDPEGRLDTMVQLPIQHPTMCSFGGLNLDVLYVTSATVFLTPEERLAQPLAGSLFAVRGLGARGVPEPFFAG